MGQGRAPILKMVHENPGGDCPMSLLSERVVN